MKLHEAISYAIEREGEDIITRPLLVNYLADLQAYDTPAIRRIVETFATAGYGETLLNSLSADNYELQINDIAVRMVNVEGYQQDLVRYVICCISYALGKTDEQPISPQTVAPTTTSVKNKQRVSSKASHTQLKFVQTPNGYETKLNGNVYVLNEGQYNAIKRRQNMPTDRLEVWLDSYTEVNE